MNNIFVAIAVFVALFSCTGKLYAAFDPEYISNFRHKLAFKTFLSQSFTSLLYTASDDKEYTYRPNTPLAFGAGISWGGITLTGSTGLDFLKDDDRGDTEFVDFQGYYYKRKLVLSFFLQQFKGIYHERSNGDFVLRPDIEMIRMGGYIEYVFNGNKFSYSSSFNQKEKQYKSSGSFLVGIGLYYDRVKSKKSFVPIPKNALSEGQNINNVQFGPSIGYAYNLIFKKNFFLSGSLSAGLNFAFGVVDSERADMELFPMIIPKFAAGYSKEDWGINLTYVNNAVTVMNSYGQKMSLTSGKFMLTYSVRFNFNPSMPRRYKRIFFRNPDGVTVTEEVPVKLHNNKK